ncbi:unnamed protein product [Haemonchus placei]|uniref:Uncharacterized protein n=1 Tax=Haemonchus placei TaxID=6290 RepID=A0A0N4WC46_HAEPC|nr:unnamed protein product [Haemonchus placei]
MIKFSYLLVLYRSYANLGGKNNSYSSLNRVFAPRQWENGF